MAEEEQKKQQDKPEAVRQISLGPILTPENKQVFEENVAIPYTTTEPTFTPRYNGVRRIYYDGTNYWLYVYTNGGWRKQPFGGVVGRSVPSATQALTAAAGFTKLVFGTNSFAAGITWNSVNNRFICATAGYYLVHGMVGFNTTTDQARYQIQIYVNGSGYGQARSRHASGTGFLTSETLDMVQLVANDYVEIFASVSTDQTATQGLFSIAFQ